MSHNVREGVQVKVTVSENELAAHYAEYYAGEPSRWREVCARSKAKNIVSLCSQIGLSSGSLDVVEIGCGDGALLQELESQGFGRAYEGYDISSSAIQIARRRHFTRPVKWTCIEPGPLPLPEGSTDLAVLSHVVEHVSDPRGLIAEALRVARYVYVEVPLEDTWSHPRHFEWTDVGHINFFTANTLRWLVESATAPVPVQILAEELTCPHREVFQYRYGRAKGNVYGTLKSVLVKVAPVLASRMLTYHGSVICSRV